MWKLYTVMNATGFYNFMCLDRIHTFSWYEIIKSKIPSVFYLRIELEQLSSRSSVDNKSLDIRIRHITTLLPKSSTDKMIEYYMLYTSLHIAVIILAILYVHF